MVYANVDVNIYCILTYINIHCVHVDVKGQLCGIGFLLLRNPGLELMLSGLLSTRFYLLSHRVHTMR